ncbi:sensor histidine kinase [Paenibacillus herberti]|uniref:histidine kinase n=1 Tax=Paenibacillus herberti TaxID=1619309 RepID=A0A229P2R4_9BACL|nr:sensor histidine kinase [Paenibacillus herberti]OXM16377.1 sensor histidine kinase [Paenibacillus herberti]
MNREGNGMHNKDEDWKKSSSTDIPATLLDARKHILVWIMGIYIASVLMQWILEFNPIPMLFFHLVLLLHCALYWHSEALTRRQPWFYISFQGILITICAFLMPQGYPPITGLYSLLIGQSVVIYQRKLKVAGVALVFYPIVTIIVLSIDDSLHLLFNLSAFTMLNVIIIAYTRIFRNEVIARHRTESFLKELEQAHGEVEKLTLANERQRMSRDLHDTLAQGLAGIVMQLDAADAHIAKGNMDRAGQIIRQSRESARIALAEARQAIDNLRLLAEPAQSFADAVRLETERFTSATGIRVELMLDPIPELSKILFEHAQYIVRESLTNIARHAKASEVRIEMRYNEDRFLLTIRDNGTGFNVEKITHEPGHYGLIVMQERARLLHAELAISSDRASGTLVKLDVPYHYAISIREEGGLNHELQNSDC